MSDGAQHAFVLEAEPAFEDLLTGRLWALGCSGLWCEDPAPGAIRIHAFFEVADESHERELRRELAEVEGARLISSDVVVATDWHARYRASAEPLPLGRHFVVDPREPGATAPDGTHGRRLLRLPIRTAFGIGSHESTRLAIEVLEEVGAAGRRAVDVGAGTGILSFAALHLGARSVLALDVDPAAALLLPEYMKLNGVRFPAFAGSLAALDVGKARFDLALVNVVPSEIEPELPLLLACLRPGAMAIFSGVLAGAAATVCERLARLGLHERRRRGAGEWVAFAMERAT